MLAWHVPYLGWTRLPTDVSEFEITHFFSLRAEERSAVLTRYRDSLRLGAGLQIGFLKMCGRPLDAVQRVPADLLKYLGEQLEISAPTIATLRALYLKRRRTLYEHQRWAMGVSREGHVFKSVKVRPRLKDSDLVAWEAPWRETKTVEPSDNMLCKEDAQSTRL
jgi:Domain of unknown function (DUF4158)